MAFCPFASRFPFETWILPKTHSSHYENIQKNGIDELAGVVREVIGRIETALDRPAYNYIIHTAPFDTQELAHYHWHIEIMPSLTRAAGFEWGHRLLHQPRLHPKKPPHFCGRLTSNPNTNPKRKRGQETYHYWPQQNLHLTSPYPSLHP